MSCDYPLEFSGKVKRVEQLSPQEGRKHLAVSRALVLAFNDTSLPSGPLVLLDGMAHGKAIIATRVGGTVDYVTHGKDGILVQPGDPERLAEAIRNVYDDESLRERIGCAAKETAEEFTARRFWRDVLCPV